MCFCFVFQEKVSVVHSQSNNIKFEVWEERKTLVIEEDKLMDCAFIKRTWALCLRPSLSHYIAHKLKKIILLIVLPRTWFPWDFASFLVLMKSGLETQVALWLCICNRQDLYICFSSWVRMFHTTHLCSYGFIFKQIWQCNSSLNHHHTFANACLTYDGFE
jgi:hypothetical protein